MTNDHSLSRRLILAAGVAALAPVPAYAQSPRPSLLPLVDLDPVRTELVMNLVVTCSSPEHTAPTTASKDGQRDDIWPIIGGRFEGPNIRGSVVPGGGDFPLVRPDGVTVIDALYRLKTDDGITILIHNRGLAYPAAPGRMDSYRLVPEFIAPVGRYDWLNRSIFLCTLLEAPAAMALAKGPNENDRLLQIHRVL
jgi:hypothetical protein